ncbi:uncharacterized protein SPPG_09117 [Spizellomyces punctatus DAOM BR117]|uniref:Deacetylase sirtuin-type domain-containing protein n=1 Tax=Spizellomyces punctatus (strain DAOM BR117) TaxID=645134 RepID=A0A0L0HKL8_SPIPD|nr:uncharacterized protein SPPG_09117 [Spizellomyces punctatus DAOM BR117]KND01637.1 hypothetical protein SPPG_09117 [Spizellomyces punctatus DAOM BR117]|eukprot:XP_016609676.1 hypothetical protein SPPG_09117 [Spizellomyces punctatus DAOM BR117]
MLVGIGAGVSTSAGISDYRSSNGLFAGVTGRAVKQGFDAHSFRDSPEQNARAFYQIAHHHARACLAPSCRPTPFHQVLGKWCHAGHIRRVYSQNIDVLDEAVEGINKKLVKMHGDLHRLRCPLCETQYALPTPFDEFWSQDFDFDALPTCPKCGQCEKNRKKAGKRTSGRVPAVLPAVVRYGEAVWNGAEIATNMQGDLLHIDGLLIAGTRMAIPGFRDFAKAASAVLRRERARSTHLDGLGAFLAIYVNREPCQTNMEKYFDFQFVGDADEFALRVQDFLLTFQCEDWASEMERRALDDNIKDFEQWGWKWVVRNGVVKREWRLRKIRKKEIFQ